MDLSVEPIPDASTACALAGSSIAPAAFRHIQTRGPYLGGNEG